MKPEGWRNFEVRELVRALTTGVSVNSQSRPRRAGEIGILKTSAVTYGVFRPEENKVVVREELHRVRENPRAGCVLVSRMNTPALVGASAFVERDWPDLVLPDRIWQVLPDPARADGRWLSYLLAAPKTRAALSELASGTSGSMKNLAQEKFMSMNLLVPPLGEQKKIAAILSSVDEAIEATQAVIDQLQVVKKAMMAELLTRGLPGRHTRFKETEIGEVPEEWEVATVGNVGRVVTGTTPQSSNSAFWGHGVPFVTPGDISDSRVVRTTERQLTAEGAAKARLLPADSVLVTCIGSTIGKVALTEQPCCTNQQINAVVPSEDWDSSFVYYALSAARPRILERASVTAVPIINKGSFEQILLPRPSRTEQVAIGKALASIDDASEANRESVAGLRALKEGLMSVLLTGEVRVRPDEAAA